jgi:hypothetical protein
VKEEERDDGNEEMSERESEFWGFDGRRKCGESDGVLFGEREREMRW